MKVEKSDLFVFIGSFFVAIGILFLNASQLIIGGTVGIGMLLQYVINYPTGVLVFFLNLPFYFLSLWYLGVKFTVKTFLSVCFFSFLSGLFAYYIPLHQLPPLIGSSVGGIFAGLGIACLLQGNSSLGGITILAVFLNRYHQVKVKNTILISDLVIVVSSCLIFSIQSVLYSIVAIVITSIVLEKMKHFKWGKASSQVS